MAGWGSLGKYRVVRLDTGLFPVQDFELALFRRFGLDPLLDGTGWPSYPAIGYVHIDQHRSQIVAVDLDWAADCPVAVIGTQEAGLDTLYLVARRTTV